MLDYFEIAKNMLKLPEDTVSVAKKIVSKFDRGKSDMAGVVAAAIYLACNLTGIKRSQATIAQALGTTEVTIRTNLYKRGMLKVAVSLSESHSHKLPQGY